jgi:DNA-directed RNA polymerase alpha subunit
MVGGFSAADKDVLCNLIISRIDILNSFELLVRLDPDRALRVLTRCYLGKGVSPDTKHGGYESELSIMLDDIVEISGEPTLRKLVKLNIDEETMKDKRVIRSFCDALSLDAEIEFLHWLEEVEGDGGV